MPLSSDCYVQPVTLPVQYCPRRYLFRGFHQLLARNRRCRLVYRLVGPVDDRVAKTGDPYRRRTRVAKTRDLYRRRTRVAKTRHQRRSRLAWVGDPYRRRTRVGKIGDPYRRERKIRRPYKRGYYPTPNKRLKPDGQMNSMLIWGELWKSVSCCFLQYSFNAYVHNASTLPQYVDLYANLAVFEVLEVWPNPYILRLFFVTYLPFVHIPFFRLCLDVIRISVRGCFGLGRYTIDFGRFSTVRGIEGEIACATPSPFLREQKSDQSISLIISSSTIGWTFSGGI